MPESDIVVRDVQWSRILPIGHLLRAFRIALWPPAKLVLALVALSIVIGAGMLLDLRFKTNVYSKSFQENLCDVFQAAQGYYVEPAPEASFTVPGAGGGLSVLAKERAWRVEKLEPRASMSPSFESMIGMRGFYFGPLEAFRHACRLAVRYGAEAPWFAVSFFAIWFLTTTFFGGAICRLAALQFARDERATLREALAFTCKRYGTLLAGRLGLFIVILLLMLPTGLVVSGVLQLGGVGQMVTGALFFLVLGLGILAALLFIFGLGSQFQILAAVAAEGRDAFDAVSRSVNYVFARPWRYFLYTLFSVFYLCLTFVVVRLFALLVLKILYVSINFMLVEFWPGLLAWFGGSGRPSDLGRIWIEPTMNQLFVMPADAEGATRVAATLIGVYVFILLGLMMAFIPSFLMTSQTIIYFILRRKVDSRDMDEVCQEFGPESGAPATVEKTEQTVVEPEPPAAGSQEQL